MVFKSPVDKASRRGLGRPHEEGCSSGETQEHRANFIRTLSQQKTVRENGFTRQRQVDNLRRYYAFSVRPYKNGQRPSLQGRERYALDAIVS